MFAIVGCYTTPDRDGRGDGIRVYRVGSAGDQWTEIQHVGGLENPSLLTLKRNQSVLYAVHGGRNLVSAFAVERDTARLTLLNQIDCQGNNPVDSALDPSERFLVVGNYGSGTVSVIPLEADGRLMPVNQLVTLSGTPGPDPVQQTSSHPHAVIFDRSGNYVVVPDKGLDKTFLFRFAFGRLVTTAQESVASKPGAAPRHTVFHPSLPILYVNNELDSTVTVFDWNAGYAAEAQVISTIPHGHRGRNTTAEIAASPCGRFLYVSNRGEDSVVLFRIAQDSGQLTYAGQTPTGGRRPRFFTLDPAGKRLYAANQDSDDIAGFRIDPDTGALQPMGVVARTGSPSAISFVDGPGLTYHSFDFGSCVWGDSHGEDRPRPQKNCREEGRFQESRTEGEGCGEEAGRAEKEGRRATAQGGGESARKDCGEEGSTEEGGTKEGGLSEEVCRPRAGRPPHADPPDPTGAPAAS